MTPWRTTTVVELCQSMRETRDYSVTPILADALQDADYTDEEVLRQLRGTLARWQAERLVALIYSDQTADAVKWMDQFAEQLSSSYSYSEDGRSTMTYEDLMAAARGYVEKRDSVTQDGGMHWQDTLSGREEEFWQHYERVKGTQVDDHQGHFFRCSC
jgi:hypothetical protein